MIVDTGTTGAIVSKLVLDRPGREVGGWVNRDKSISAIQRVSADGCINETFKMGISTEKATLKSCSVARPPWTNSIRTRPLLAIEIRLPITQSAQDITGAMQPINLLSLIVC